MPYYSPEGKPIDLFEWAKLFEARGEAADESWWRIQTEVGDHTVSTVWLGIDHNFSGDGPPLIFESMIFGDDDELEIRRYATWEEARVGHEELVQSLSGPE